eukprot:9469409-Pyramimonas_sp.AAC.1
MPYSHWALEIASLQAQTKGLRYAQRAALRARLSAYCTWVLPPLRSENGTLHLGVHQWFFELTSLADRSALPRASGDTRDQQRGRRHVGFGQKKMPPWSWRWPIGSRLAH